ncbi:MAG: J domain-containing protein [Thermoanaerobaculaceae bacterium]
MSVFSSGDLGPGELPSLLRRLHLHLASGCLHVMGRDGLRRFWLEVGQIRALESDVEEEKIGQWLVNNRVLEREQLALTLLRQEDGALFGDLVLKQGLLQAEELHEHLKERGATILAKLLFSPVSYEFREKERADPRIAVLDVTMGDLLLSAVRRVPDGELLRKAVNPKCFVCVSGEPLFREQKVHLSPAEGFLLSRVDGRTTAEQLKRLVPIPEGEFYRALVGLVFSGVLELREEPPQGPVGLPLTPEEPELLSEQEVVFAPNQAAEHQRILQLAGEVEKQNYYARLGLSPGAGQDQIHQRFRELARLYHPDRASEPHLRTLRAELAKVFTALKDAYETLSHPERRARYDQFLKQTSGQGTSFDEEERQRKARLDLARANRAQAEVLIKAGDFGGALPFLEQAVRFDPQGETLLQLARLELRNPMWAQRALSHLKMAVTLEPQLTEGWLELARFWGRRRQNDKALACVEKILEYDPTNAEALALRRQLK